MAIIISIIGVAITLLEVGFIIFKYSKESKRKCRSETIEKYNKIFNDTYSLRDKFFDITGKNLFDSKDIRKNKEIYKEVMNQLTVLESFAKGLEYGVYDFKTFIYLTPNELFEILNSLKQFVYDERKEKAYELLFNDFIYLTDVMSISIRAKTNGKRVNLRYKSTRKK
jgi:hypothetical protein